MKTSLFAGLVVVLITLQCCKKKETIIDDKPQVKLLTRVVFAIGTNAVFKYFTYDAKNRLKTVKDGSTTTTYTYNSDELSIIEVVNSVSGPISKTEFTYNSGKITQAVEKEPSRTRIYGYIYVGNDLSEIHVNVNGVVVEKLIYTILNHNITKKVDVTPDGTFTTEYTYGSHKNIFYHSRLSQLLGIEGIDRYSLNDLLEFKRTNPDGSFVKEINSYAYDEDGIPITSSNSVVLSPNIIAFEGKYTYEYELGK